MMLLECGKKTMDKVQEITIFATDETAKQFIAFQKHYDVFMLLMEKKVFEQKNATVSLDFDKFGALKAIRRNDFLFTTKE